MPTVPTLAGATHRAAWRLPSLCAICRGWGRSRVCDPCWTRFAPSVSRCPRCAVALAAGSAIDLPCGRCLVAPTVFDSAVARVDYRRPWDQVVAAFKFHGALDLAGALASSLADAIGDASEVDAVVPVPLAPARLRQRGCNQAWELARRVAFRVGVPADAGLVVRIRETAHQIELPQEARPGNVRGAFAVEPTRRADLRGRRIAVVDDVMTTGSTLGEIAAVLKQAGAVEVRAWVFARTPAPGDE